MKTTEQGVLYREIAIQRCLSGRAPGILHVALTVFISAAFPAVLFASLLLTSLLITYLLPSSALADDMPSLTEEDVLEVQNLTQPGEHGKHPVVILYSPDSRLQKSIYENLVRSLTLIASNIDLSTITDSTGYIPENYQPELVITLGANNIEAANRHFLNTHKLLVISNPGRYDPDMDDDADSDALLFMTQPYCRQIHFIRLINERWKIISYLNGEQNPIDKNRIEECANEFGLSTHEIWTSDEHQLSRDVKDALYHGDLLLALPDRTIYNSKTVKNILLTSYRIRKPVIAFSRSFVNAGAIAAIYSNTQQISESASDLVLQYFANEHRFKQQINYPETFDISFNRQVFKALGLKMPDKELIIDKLRTSKNSEINSQVKTATRSKVDTIVDMAQDETQ